MARNGVFYRILLLAGLGVAAGSCTSFQSLDAKVKDLKLKDLIEPAVPDSSAMAGVPPSYRALSNIPDAPAAPALATRDSAVESLKSDQAATAEAAKSLREAPFTQPDPAPPPEIIMP